MIAMISPGLNCCEHTLNTLRYADRVKELGPGDVVEDKAMTVDEQDDSSVGQRNSALAMLRTGNEEEVSEELLTFHKAVFQMQAQEEELIDCHHQVTESTEKWLAKDRELLAMTENVDYDVEEYASQLDELLTKKIQMMTDLKALVGNFRQELQVEENLSRNIKTSARK